jgi:hypothetical protein
MAHGLYAIAFFGECIGVGSILERPSTKQYKTVLGCICAVSPLNIYLRADSGIGLGPLPESGLR